MQPGVEVSCWAGEEWWVRRLAREGQHRRESGMTQYIQGLGPYFKFPTATTMDRAKQSRGALLINNLPQLQNLVKRDPQSYREEFLQQWNHYDSIRCLYEAKPDDTEGADRFRELVTFISQVCHCYKEETKEFPGQLSSLLMEHYGTLNQDLKKSLVQNMVLLRNKDVITSIEYVCNGFIFSET